MSHKQRILNVLLLLGLTLFSSCNGDIASFTEQPSSQDYSQLAELLEHAYQQHSQDTLNIFFESWMNILPAYTPKQIATFSDTVRQIYSIFRKFYSPTDLDRLTGGNHENFETDFRYIVVQNSMRYAVVDTSPRYYFYQGVTSYEKQIQDFRPAQGNLPFPVIYLSTQADSIVYHFLFQPDGTPRADHQGRVDFLRQAMQLTHHHWISDYHKATMPIVSQIYMDEPLKQALVNFRIFYQFGEAYLEKKDGDWTLISSKLTAIE